MSELQSLHTSSLSSFKDNNGEEATTLACFISAIFAHGNWPSGPYGSNHQPFGMRRNIFYYNNPELAPQNYHYQQMNGNQLVNQQSDCNCIKLKFCSPVMEMARKMYSGFIADYINSQLQVIACNYIDGEMAVCCPKNMLMGNPDSREKRGNTKHGHEHDKKWIWDTEDVTSSEEVNYQKHQQAPRYPMNQYVSYPIQGFYPFSKANLQMSKPFLANYEDENTFKNCPPAFSKEFTLPANHTFYKEAEVTTTPVSRVEIVTTPTPDVSDVTPEMQAKMSLINQESCGQSVGSRIIGGQDAGVGRFSWMGRLAYRNKSKLNLIQMTWCQLLCSHCLSPPLTTESFQF